MGLTKSLFPTQIFFKEIGETEVLGEYRFSFLLLDPKDSKFPCQFTLKLLKFIKNLNYFFPHLWSNFFFFSHFSTNNDNSYEFVFSRMDSTLYILVHLISSNS